jgi:hypothetical protein
VVVTLNPSVLFAALAHHRQNLVAHQEGEVRRLGCGAAARAERERLELRARGLEPRFIDVPKPAHAFEHDVRAAVEDGGSARKRDALPQEPHLPLVIHQVISPQGAGEQCHKCFL